jgi:hypothetical protein
MATVGAMNLLKITNHFMTPQLLSEINQRYYWGRVFAKNKLAMVDNIARIVRSLSQEISRIASQKFRSLTLNIMSLFWGWCNLIL